MNHNIFHNLLLTTSEGVREQYRNTPSSFTNVLSGHYVPTKWFAEGEQPELNPKTSACLRQLRFLTKDVYSKL
jgi:hypothetical protein